MYFLGPSVVPVGVRLAVYHALTLTQGFNRCVALTCPQNPQSILSEFKGSRHCYGRYKTPQVLLNRVPEQATEDRVKYQIYY